MSITKAKPMTAAEFARYAAGIPKEKQAEFDAMLAFVEDTVRGDCAKVVGEFKTNSNLHSPLDYVLDAVAKRMIES